MKSEERLFKQIEDVINKKVAEQKKAEPKQTTPIADKKPKETPVKQKAAKVPKEEKVLGDKFPDSSI